MDAVRTMDAGSVKIVLVVDGDDRLLGTVTDGDVRRGILKGVGLEESVEGIMNTRPRVASIDQSRDSIRELMAATLLHHIPLVDGEGRVIGIEVIDEVIGSQSQRDNWVLIMAGGLGTRLLPLTENTPKPLLKVGGKPLLETILENLIEQGFGKFYLAVNYRAEMVKEHFRDGARWGVEIRYLEEDARMGTAGALSLIPEAPDQPIIVMNGDLLTKVSFGALLDYHGEHGAIATMAVREYDFQVPFGVVETDHHKVVSIEEKPVHRFFVNAGIYILDPACLTRVPKGQIYDMPTLLNGLMADEMTVCAFPIRELWVDIGHLEDFQKANQLFPKFF
jgi:dTDP-glucose pyrophosphorylase